MKNIYIVSAILSVSNEYTFTEYMSLNKSDIIDRFLSFERNGFEIRCIKMTIDETEVGFKSYEDFYITIGNLSDELNYSMTRCPTR